MNTSQHPDDVRQLERWCKAQILARMAWRRACAPSRESRWAHFGVRENRSDLLVPMRDESGALWDVQYLPLDFHPARSIWANHQPAYLGEARPQGLRHCIGGATVDAVGVTMHLHDAVTVHGETGWPAVVAFEPENLATVAASLRSLHPQARIVLWVLRVKDLDVVRAAADTADVEWADADALDAFDEPDPPGGMS